MTEMRVGLSRQAAWHAARRSETRLVAAAESANGTGDLLPTSGGQS